MVEALKAAAHFRRLSDQALGRLARVFAEQELGAGEAVYRVGEPAGVLYVVVRGTVVVLGQGSRLDGGRPRACLRSGDIVGVADFFDSEVRSEAARTTEETTLLRGAKADLLEFLEQEPQVELNLRLAAASDLTARAKVSLAVAQRRVVRHRVNQEVRLTSANGTSTVATLVDLSVLGLCLGGVPESWGRDDTVRCQLAWDDRRHELVGRVAWREADHVGIELHDPTAGQQAELRQTLEKMLQRVA